MIDQKIDFDTFLFSLPIYVNSIDHAESIIDDIIGKGDLTKFLNSEIKHYEIKSEQDAFLSIIHFLYSQKKVSIDREYAKLRKSLLEANSCYNTYTQKIINCYKSLGLKIIDIPDINVVDTYPYPFQALKGRALAPDKTDQKRYGIPNSMYLRRASIREIFTPIIIAHELFHYHINDNELLARGLEEAIADFVSIFVFASNEFGPNFAYRYFVEMRYGRGSTSQRFDLYVDDIIKLHIMINRDGWEPIITACKNGRKSLKELEYSSLSDINYNDDEKNIAISQANQLLSNLIFRTPRNQTLSPLSVSYMLSKNGAPFSMPIDISTKALDEIQSRIFGVLHDNGTIEFDDFKYLTKENVIIIDTFL